MASQEFSRGNELYVQDLFDQAADAYSRAIELDGKVPQYYLHRATNSIKLFQYQDALSDISTCLEMDAVNPLAYQRRGDALFRLERFAEAKTAYRKASSDGLDSSLQLRRCEAHLRRPAATTSSRAAPTPIPGRANARQATKTAVRAATTSAAPAKSSSNWQAVPSSVVGPASTTAASAPRSVTLASRVKTTHILDLDKVTLTIIAKNVQQENVSITYGEQEITVQLTLSDASVFTRTWHLWAAVENPATLKLDAYKAEIELKKVTAVAWDSLEAEGADQLTTSRPNEYAEEMANKRRAETERWNSVAAEVKAAEEAEKPEGQEALHALFKQIYAGADADTRRAMIKSYQTSGGTVLSTNWDEVEHTDYEKNIQPPKGMEVRRW